MNPIRNHLFPVGKDVEDFARDDVIQFEHIKATLQAPDDTIFISTCYRIRNLTKENKDGVLSDSAGEVPEGVRGAEQVADGGSAVVQEPGVPGVL